jgi:hypothetical protein
LNYRDFKIQDFEFVDEGSWIIKAAYYFSYYSARILLGPDRVGPSPVRFKASAKGPTNKVPPLDAICAAIGYDALTPREMKFHRRRLIWRKLAVFLLYLLFASAFLALLIKGLAPLIDPLTTTKFVNNHHSASLSLLILFGYVYIFVAARMSFRLATALTARGFADSLCAQAIVYLILELSRDDVLSHPKKRRGLIGRTNDLARNTLLLSARHRSKSEANQSWLREHFRRMERYIRERERWAIVPTPTTLDDLRRDFYNLAGIYLSGDYGEFNWSEGPQPAQTEPTNISERITQGLPRVLGILLPLVLMLYFLWNRKALETLGIDPKVVALIFMAWLLLGIDATLKLGIVSGVVNLAKEIKNLK